MTSPQKENCAAMLVFILLLEFHTLLASILQFMNNQQTHSMYLLYTTHYESYLSEEKTFNL